MRYLKAKFKGYAGFYNGLGLNEIEIDFTKCLHNIVLIHGMNGCGKSTLLDSLSVFPDSSSSFLPDQDGEKILELMHEGDYYLLQLFSPSDLKGGRKTTKAYIQKNGVELNENGNVSSYKDIIFSEFELDSNYVSLSKLSSNDRGLGDKKPAERKKFVSSIIENLETYNTIYKTLNKKSLLYKSHVNTLHTKIQNIGMKDQLEITLKGLQKRESELNQQITGLNNQIVALQTKNSLDAEETQRYNQLSDSEKQLKTELDTIENSVNLFQNKTKIAKEEVESVYDSDQKLLSEYQNKISVIHESWKSKYDAMNSTYESINSMKAEIESSNNIIDHELENKYNHSNQVLNEIVLELKKEKYTPDVSMIPDISDYLRFSNNIINQVDSLYDNMNPKDMKFLCYKFDQGMILQKMNLQKQLIVDLDNKKQELSELQSNLKIISVLDNRPKNCKINTCVFIADALKAKSKNPHIVEDLSKIQEEIMQISESISETQSEIDFLQSLVPKKTKLDILRDTFEKNNTICVKFGLDFQDILSRISDLNLLNDLRDQRRWINILNLLKQYETEQKENEILKVKYDSYIDKIKMINSNKNRIQKLESEYEELSSQVKKLKSDINNYQSLSDTLSGKIANEINYINIYHQYLEVKQKYDNVVKELNEFKKKFSKSMESLPLIESMSAQINSLNNELLPITSDINKISGELILLDSYYKDYNDYKSSYDMIETLKKYCSPTSGGIQTLFMQLYMHKTLELSNQILMMLFSGEYQLLDFVINEDEFRIPFIGSGLPVDDISSGSTSQICMFGMIINLVLLHQASTKFNIAKLDEVDGGLDSRNRFGFVNVLYNIMPMLGIEQLFIISHSMEQDTSNADIIKLKSYSDYEDVITGNIIYDYQKYIEKTLK